MASVLERPGGRKSVRFYDLEGCRRTVALGKCSKRDAERVATFTERILEKRRIGEPLDGETARWLASVSNQLAAKLAACGLIEPRQENTTTLGPWIDAYIEGRKGVKPSTKTTWRQARANLVTFFGEGKLIAEITPGDADRFKEYLQAEAGLSPPTAGKRLQTAKQFFRAMHRARVIPENPFVDLKAPTLSNPDRFRFVTREETQKIIDACPDAHWRCIVALARFGGLRCPSEVLSLRWEGIDWANRQMRVDSPKTEHHHGGAFRMVPLFPELVPYLRESFEVADEGQVYVIPERFRKASYKAEVWKCVNLRTTFTKIVKRAGLEPWPRLFQNLRSSRETELVEQFPVHVVTAWIGNTPKVAQRHYLQVTDEHFRLAVGGPEDDRMRAPTGAPIGAPVDAGNGRNRAETPKPRNAKTPVKTGVCRAMPNYSQLGENHQLGGTGFEPDSVSGLCDRDLRKSGICGAPSGAPIGALSDEIPPELRAVWDTLSDDQKQALVEGLRRMQYPTAER